MMQRPDSCLFYNGRIYRDAGDQRPADAILVECDSVRWIGDIHDAPSASRAIDAQGATILPGITDAHVHLFAIANGRLQLDGGAFPTIHSLLSAIAERARRTPQGHWIQVGGFDQNRLTGERRYPLRTELDAAAPDHPVVVRRFCGHVAIANSAALAASGVSSAADAPEGGIFGELTDGALDGSALEAAADLVFRSVPPFPTPELTQALRDAMRLCNGFGITAAVEAAVGFTCGFDAEFAAWNELRTTPGSLPLRLGFMLQLEADAASARGLRPTRDRDWQLDTLKFFSDGIVGGRSAAVFEPYEDTGGTGMFMRPEKELERALIEAAHAGWRVAVHSVGDRSTAAVLDIFEKMAALGGQEGRRHRIEHFFCPPEDGYARLAQLGALLVMQPNFLSRMQASFVPAFGARTELMYPGRSAMAAGVDYVASSDAPTGTLSPWIGIADAIDRAERSGGPFGPAEALTPREALGAYIHGGVHAMRHETWRGRLIPNLAADLIVLDRDPLNASADEIRATQCLLTMVRGEIVHEKDDTFRLTNNYRH